MAELNRSFLFVPAAGAGEGMGHLTRCLRLAGQLGPLVTFLTARMDSGARVLLTEELRRLARERSPGASGRPRLRAVEKLRPSERWDLILVDAHRTTRGELDRLMRHGLVVCLDEGGDARDYAPYLVDAIPGLPGNSHPNLCSPVYLDLPQRRRARLPMPIKKVLLSFGGEDRQDLTGRLIEMLLRERVFAAEQMTVVEGPLFATRTWPPGMGVIRGPANLERILLDYDLLFTHFGITAFEALASGIPVVLVNPGNEHARLSAAAGLPAIGILNPVARRLRALLRNPARIHAPVTSFNASVGKDRGRRLARLAQGLATQGSSSCPVCAAIGNRAIARFADRTYRRCGKCGIVYLESFAATKQGYGRKYFTSEYKAQYGRTYLEDFASIKAACRPRVKVIQELLGGNGDGVIVDVGCAYGPFLDALKEAGVSGYGVDVSPVAVAHVRKKLGIPALCASFEQASRGSLPGRICAITFWYVIEHFKDTDMAFRKAMSLLPLGGVLAFSTPNGHGISSRRSMTEYLSNSPADHCTIFSPQGLRRILSRYGLALRRIRVTGHHPERFPGVIGQAASRWRPAHGLLQMASRLLGLGDTFEAYAVKED